VPFGSESHINSGDHPGNGLIGSHFLAAINNYLQNLNHYENEIKRPFSIVKKIAPETEPSELKTFETLNIDSFDALQFIVALDES
jgi:hypothetical protein